MGWLGRPRARECLDPDIDRAWPPLYAKPPFPLVELVLFIADGGCGRDVLRPMPPRVCVCRDDFSKWVGSMRREGGTPIGPARGDGWLDSYLSWSTDTPESGFLGHNGDGDSFHPELVGRRWFGIGNMNGVWGELANMFTLGKSSHKWLRQPSQLGVGCKQSRNSVRGTYTPTLRYPGTYMYLLMY